MQKKSFNAPDSVMSPPKTKVEIVNIAGTILMRDTFEPGWKWSEHIKPAAGTDSCQAHHVLIGVSGHLKVVMNDGVEVDIGPGDVVDVPPGHDAWVVGSEPAMCIDVAGAKPRNG